MPILRHIYNQARINPSGIAVDYAGKNLTFLDLNYNIAQFSEQLTEYGITLGDIVLTCYATDKLTELVISLSLSNIGAISCSIGGYQNPKVSFQPKFIITDKIFLTPEYIKVHSFTRSDIKKADNKHLAQAPLTNTEDKISRLVLTSGTTGHKKAVPLTSTQIFMRAMQGANLFSSISNEISLFGLSTIGGYLSTIRSLIAGKVFYPDIRDIESAIIQNKIGIISGSPIQIYQILPILNRVRSRSLSHILVGGSKVPQTLIKHINSNLGISLLDYYGASEVGGVYISVHHPGQPKPNLLYLDEVKIQAVDIDDAPLPANTSGLIRIRTPFMSAGYFNENEASNKHFRNGWFYPGDTGVINEKNEISIIGRVSEIINVGGVKIDPNLIDDFINQLPGVKDCATFGLCDKSGLEQIAIAITPVNKLNLIAIKKLVVKKFGINLEPKFFFRVNSIPRNAMGKILRGDLKLHFEKMLRDTIEYEQ